jgi:hypothetical protein
MRERVEDLGKIAVMASHALKHGVFELYHGRNKDFTDYFDELEQDARDELLHNLIYGLDAIQGILLEIKLIADGLEDE